MNLTNLIRKNIQQLKPYSTARSEFKGEASVFLDANENPFNNPYSRYPDPLQEELKEKISRIKEISPTQIMLGVGSDEPIDLVVRIFCEPRVDNIVAMDPTYGMYQVCADINDVEYRKVLLNEDYTLDSNRLLAAIDTHTKVIFLCSPNNPTGNLLDQKQIEHVLRTFQGIVVIDEAYIDFSSDSSWLTRLDKYPHLIILQTFSKAWGLASVRCGMAFASEEIIQYFNKVKYPYNINLLTQDFVSQQLEKTDQHKAWVQTLIEEREKLAEKLRSISWVEKIFPSDANFLLVKVPDANKIYNELLNCGIIVRNRNSISLCKGCLRVTVGTPSENNELMGALKAFKYQ